MHSSLPRLSWRMESDDPLRVLEAARLYGDQCVKIAHDLPRRAPGGLRGQLAKAAQAVSDLLAEGLGRRTVAEKLRYYDMSKGELEESQNQLRRCVRLRSEEHTSELQSRRDLVCRLLLEKKKKSNKRRAKLNDRYWLYATYPRNITYGYAGRLLHKLVGLYLVITSGDLRCLWILHLQVDT